VASYDAKINVLLSGLRDLVLLEDRLEKISSIVNTLNKTPIALNVGGRGKERDLSGQLSKEVNDYVREWVNGGKNIGKSINAVRQQQAAFNELLRETALIQQDKKAEVAVNNLAQAWADTTRAATEYDKKLNDIQRKALGLQPQAVRDLEVARREAFVASGGKTARRERATFLEGAPVSQFPTGPNPRSTRGRFEGDTPVERAESALRARELTGQLEDDLKRVQDLRVKGNNQRAQFFAQEKAEFAVLEKKREDSAKAQARRIQNLGKAVRGSLSSAAIGGAFPLLFGQSPQAAVGGAIGGLLGGAGGGFAGSLLGTALGELEAAKARTKELALELGLTSTQAKTLATAFELAGRNSQQLEAAVTNIQGLGLSTQETASAIKIAVELSKEYGGSVEKIAQAFADTLESGKVSVSTLNKFTAQGIPIQDQLAEKLGVSRTKLLEMAKDGKISVQQVTDVLVDMGQEAEKTADKGKTGFDRFVKAVEGIATAIAGAAGAILKNLVPALDTVLTKLSNIITRATQALSLIADAQVGEASAALARSGMARGTLFGVFTNKGNIDDLAQGLKSLQPLSAKTKEQFDRIADVAQRYRVELSKYGDTLGEYAVGTAQVELTRVEKDLAAARKLVGAPARPDAITDITAPANLPPSGGGGKSAADKAAKDAERERERVAELVRSQALVTAELKRQEEFSAKIFAAELAKDPMLARRLKGEQQLVEWGYETANLLEKEESIHGQLAIARVQQAKQALILQKTTQDLVKLENDRVESANKDIAALENELEIKNALTQVERDRLRIEYEMQVLSDSKKFDQDQLNRIEDLKKQIAAPTLGADLIRKQIGTLSDELLVLTDVGTRVTAAAASIGDAFSASFKGVISGSMSAQEALASFFQSVADHFLDMAAQIIAKMIKMAILNAVLGVLPGGSGFAGNAAGFGGTFDAGIPAIGNTANFSSAFGGARANGGPVSSGQTYMVGERGPELFVPGRSGTIVPNGAMGGDTTNVVVNVDAKGSSVEGNEQGANQLGRVISAAVQSELIKQQRPGGLLTR
jgi:tape measure domain-containing protein